MKKKPWTYIRIIRKIFLEFAKK